MNLYKILLFKVVVTNFNTKNIKKDYFYVEYFFKSN